MIACVDDPSKVRESNERNNCKAAPGKLTIGAAGGTAEAPAELIAADLAAGKLTAAQALEYRVLSRFGDPALPARYAGAAGDHEDDGAMRAAASGWAGLSKAQRKRIGKYFQPFALRSALEADPASVSKRKGKGGSKGKRSAEGDDEIADDVAPEVCDSDYFKVRSWSNVTAAGGKVRLHWETSNTEDGKAAKALVGDVTRAYARFKQMLGREPLSDAKVDCYHGPDGALDVYVTDVHYKAGVTVPSTQSNVNDGQCQGYPAFIGADPKHPSFKLGFTVVHELFHAFQMAYPYRAGCKDAVWLDEGSATWAAHLIYPSDQTEHLFSAAIQYPDNGLGDYTSWVFFLWAHQRFGDSAVRKSYEALRQRDSMDAVNGAIGTFRKEFLDFARHGWNQAPFPSFVEWDQLATLPRPHYEDVVPRHLFLAGQKERTAYAKFELRALSRDYKRYVITDEKVRRLTFNNVLHTNPDAQIGAILTFADGSQRFEDWSRKEKVRFCRDQPEQDVRELVLVYASSIAANRYTPGDRLIDGTPELQLADSCEDLPWHFKVLSGQMKTTVDGSRPGDTAVGLCALDGYATRDVVDFTAAAAGAGFQAGKHVLAKGAYGSMLSGEFSIHADQPTSLHTLTGCKGWDDGSPITKCTATHADNYKLGHDVGATLLADSRDAAEATVQWWLPPAIAGFFDANDSVCNVGQQHNHVDEELVQSKASMRELESGRPVTLTHSGSMAWGPLDVRGEKGSLSYEWEFELRVQRVKADGSPL